MCDFAGCLSFLPTSITVPGRPSRSFLSSSEQNGERESAYPQIGERGRKKMPEKVTSPVALGGAIKREDIGNPFGPWRRFFSPSVNDAGTGDRRRHGSIVGSERGADELPH
ncbi:hypothetical protein MTO96_013416 [Rhipicephalus appendiculatus]